MTIAHVFQRVCVVVLVTTSLHPPVDRSLVLPAAWKLAESRCVNGCRWICGCLHDWNQTFPLCTFRVRHRNSGQLPERLEDVDGLSKRVRLETVSLREPWGRNKQWNACRNLSIGQIRIASKRVRMTIHVSAKRMSSERFDFFPHIKHRHFAPHVSFAQTPAMITQKLMDGHRQFRSAKQTIEKGWLCNHLTSTTVLSATAAVSRASNSRPIC